MEVETIFVQSLSGREVLRFASVMIAGMTLLLTSVASYFLERRHGQRPMFALVLVLLAWVMLTLGSATSGVGRLFPPILVMAPLFSGFTGPALFIYTRRLTSPHRPASLKWLWLGLFGTTYSLLSLSLPGGLDYATEAIVHDRPYWHPLLSPFMAVQSVQLAIFILTSTALITRAYWTQSHPDLRQTQFWLLVTCWTCLFIVVLTNVLPSFQVLMTGVEPALVALPLVIVGCLSVRALGVELQSVRARQLEDRTHRMESLGRMARGMAHDLNNVLAAIIGHAEIARLKTPQEDSVTSNLQRIIEGGQRAADLLNRMMTFSGRVDEIRFPIAPKGPIEAAYHAIAPLQKPSCRMNLELASELPSIRIDPNELSIVLDNLLVNAVQALEQGRGCVTLRALPEASPRIPSDALGASLDDVPCLRVEVEDTGHGMTSEEASRALEPFYSTRPNGKGLGLVGVLSTIKGAGGALWFSSRPGAGTRFVIWLPVADEAPDNSRNLAMVLPENVLVIDDDPEVTGVLSGLLESLGVHAYCFESGEQVIAFLDTPHGPVFELAIVDIRLGAMDGIELGHRLLHHHGCARLLLISGDEPGPRLAQFEGRPVVFHRKPLTLENLRKMLLALGYTVPTGGPPLT